MRLTNAKQRRSFEEFCKSTNSTKTSLCFASILGVINLVFYGFAISEAKLDYILICCLAFTVAIRLPLLFYIVYSKIKKTFQSNVESTVVRINNLENFYAVSTCATIGMSMLARVLTGQCEGSHVWSCNAEHQARALPQEHVLILMLCPLVFSVVFRAINWENVCLSWLIVVGFCLLCILSSEAYQSLPLLGLYVVISAFVLYENQKQRLSEYFVSERLKVSVAEAELQAHSSHEQEMKRMMGNVAHDLKTVSPAAAAVYCCCYVPL